MVEHIHKCTSCEHYTMENKCPVCGSATLIPRPPKYSPDDKYAKIKRDIKKEELKEKKLY